MAEPSTPGYRPSLEGVDWAEVDFLDLGCSSGGSIVHCVKRFGAQRGIGVDVDPGKLADAAARGYDVAMADAKALDVDRRVRFVSMLDFLEHLPDLESVEAVIASAARAATDFLYIKHPSFEGEELAEALGFRQYWWHWSGHKAHVRISDYCRMLDRLELGPSTIRYVEPIHDSSHTSVIPYLQEKNVGPDRAATLTAPPLAFRPPLWRLQENYVALRPFAPEEWRAITGPPPRGS